MKRELAKESDRLWYGCRSFLSWMGFALGSSSLMAETTQHFDKKEYSLSGSFDTPMNTIAGLTNWAQEINHVYGITTVILVFVFFAVCIPLVYTIVKFRVKDEDLERLPPPKQIHGNVILELTWTIIPIILLLFIAVPTWETIFNQPDKAPEDAMVVEVIGHQWWWEFRYPSLGITTANELHLPEKTPVFFKISSVDVIHSFWVPKWGGKIDAIPGKTNHIFLTTPVLQKPDQKGGEYYQGQCVELCGLSHALMRFEAVVHKQDEFDQWAKVYNEAPKIGSALEKKGETVFNQCAACHTIAGTPSEEMEKQMLASDANAFKIGPNLTNFGNRRKIGAGTRDNTEGNFHEWVHNPPALKPGSKMQALGLSDEDIKAVAAYLRLSTVKEF